MYLTEVSLFDHTHAHPMKKEVLFRSYKEKYFLYVFSVI